MAGQEMSGMEDYTFACPECDESFAVNESMKTAIIDSGCVICGTEITDDAFQSL